MNGVALEGHNMYLESLEGHKGRGQVALGNSSCTGKSEPLKWKRMTT